MYWVVRPDTLTEQDEELSAVLSEYSRQLGEFGTLEHADPATEVALASLEQTYFNRLRPKLVDKALPAGHGRLKVWLVLQANPSRAQLAELRQYGREWVSSDALDTRRCSSLSARPGTSTF